MADVNVNKSDNGDLAAQMALILDKLTNLETKVDNIAKQNEERLEKLEGRVFDVEQKQDGLEKVAKDIVRNQTLKDELVAGLESEVKLNTAKGLDNEQYQRNFNIRIFNLEENESETIEQCEEKVIKLFNEKLGVNVKIDDIDVLHRLGPKRKNQKDIIEKTNEPETSKPENQNETNLDGDLIEGSPDRMETQTIDSESVNKDGDGTEAKQSESEKYSRPIIVSFLARRVRRLVLMNRSKLKKKPNQTTKPIIITEDLTKWHHALLSKAKDSEKFDGGVWSKNGKIFGKHKGRVKRIKGFADIDAVTLEMNKSAHLQNTNRRRGGNYRGRGYPGRGYPRFQPSRGQGRFGPAAAGTFHPLWGSPFSERGLISTRNRFDVLYDGYDPDSWG